MKNNFLRLLTAFMLLGAIVSCRKEQPVYEINNEPVNLNTIDKNTLKRQTEFISQAHADLFGKPIGSNALEKALICYGAFSDKELVEDMMIRDLIRAATGKIPERDAIEANVDSFATATYKKFYHRSPNVMELWNLRNMIQQDTTVNPGMIYYAIMTSDEYKFY